MAQEIEAKILNIDVPDLEKKLLDLGASREGEKFFRSISFDYPGFPLDKESSWVRLRDEGDKITLAYKKRLGVQDMKNGMNDSGMEEIEVKVSDFDTTTQFLFKLGLIAKFSQEKKRITWKKGSVTYDIDTWPKLQPYLEVEGDTWEAVDSAIMELGFDLKDKKICSATQIYQLAGIRDKDYTKMTFSEFIKRD
jgi:adenylate cyclase, class 2